MIYITDGLTLRELHSGLFFQTFQSHSNIKKNMQTYCVSCKKDTENKDAKIIKTKNGRLQMRSQCSICGNKESRVVKEQEAKGFLSL